MEIKKVALILALCALLPGCAEITVSIPGDNNTVLIEQPKTVTASPAANGNTIPVSALP